MQPIALIISRVWTKYLPLRVAQPLRVSSVSWLIASVESSPEIKKRDKNVKTYFSIDH